ncbi:MAG: Crp/Fnr family transcriptional regulator [Chromatiaceae bacterium]|nr:Crp/Fnr family transcriptional regulator [Gammaproteobacteria bacterium]MCB1874085.1 Crp/Fnr family transcriptional regulator [Gammaproteobacteria bacterium]MCB1880380.1 Crp/Fnr family transcriptional regulator [Gammaproteobacteria bacterium]MCP5448083.1 Crp/Fnr family transcriptional regulator [Chromatiaceae bacterium]
MKNPVSDKEAWEGHADCLSCTLRNSVLFSGLEEKDFENIHQPIDLYTLPPGSVLYRAGDPGERLFTIRAGILKLVQYLPDGTQRIVRLLRSTDVTGLEVLLGQSYQHDAVVLQSTQACSLPVSVVRALSQTNPALHKELLNRWQKALIEADAWLTELSTGSAKQRVARLLLRLVRDEQSSQCALFSREDMGAMLGITTETASRTIAEFKRQSLLVETTPNNFLLDIRNLERIAAG